MRVLIDRTEMGGLAGTDRADGVSLEAAYAVDAEPWLRANMVSTVDGAGTGSDGRVPIQVVAFDKSIHRVNGAPVVGNPDVRTGDVVTWRLTATVAAGAVGGLVLTDYFPQPLFDAQEHGATPIVGITGPIRFGPSNSLPGTVPVGVTTAVPGGL